MSKNLTFALHELVAELTAATDHMLTDRYGVSSSQFAFIAILVEAEPTDVTGLAHCLGVSKAAVSKRLPSMVKAGLITTADDPQHGRRVLIRATDRARDLVERAGRDLDTQFTALFADPRASDIDPAVLNDQLHTLIALVKENGPLT